MDEETGRSIEATTATYKLAAVETEWREAKLDGTLTPELRTKLSDTRRWYRERWRPVDPNGVQPQAAQVRIATIG